MKVAPLYLALAKADWARVGLVHTGQHFSAGMSDRFFEDLKLPLPDYNLAARGETPARQTAATMIAYEDLLHSARPDWTVVAGDVDSTLAATLAAKKLGVKVAHLEAGLRSFDRTMPEEINRILTDSISDLLWTPSLDADANLLREGVAPERIERIGNIMIDSYAMLAERIAFAIVNYAVATLHRPANVDVPTSLSELVNGLRRLADVVELVLPVHPRTRSRLEQFGLMSKLDSPRMHILDPLGYVDFMSLISNAALVVTDSGGVQEETTYIGVPCLTLRSSTERPITVSEGTNKLVTLDNLLEAAMAARAKRRARPKIDLWDGQQHEVDPHDRCCCPRCGCLRCPRLRPSQEAPAERAWRRWRWRKLQQWHR
jgi:UDP-N-acetylglucosamine 2-epimerase (non-hydrolysing)